MSMEDVEAILKSLPKAAAKAVASGGNWRGGNWVKPFRRFWTLYRSAPGTWSTVENSEWFHVADGRLIHSATAGDDTYSYDVGGNVEHDLDPDVLELQFATYADFAAEFGYLSALTAAQEYLDDAAETGEDPLRLTGAPNMLREWEYEIVPNRKGDDPWTWRARLRGSRVWLTADSADFPLWPMRGTMEQLLAVVDVGVSTGPRSGVIKLTMSPNPDEVREAARRQRPERLISEWS